ncbi:hypothetical protein KC343_g4211 [Hortaea werneckii]|uniref:FAD dependent oxidoreductase domain-containing protein n=1 Tax=Hortaea werneckii TaxID=91943 RepID=A0A3M7GI06_HORWE|nr:hypothetical protein KC352_g9559 [Hortaea werneckii]KAI7568352.1 hypothetical protein KC317_g4276 [Hortaea werneckii]KAI7621456.1 hypothetical protein KC346_g3634 [Hortaea werneckii]KAI7631140.1 hypothetical protein KC343_g4211 [Hortaea werneckii]KAI7677331.1 hypothetical protein KC319_g3948 [Hortaea werneckii]
MSSKGHIVVLGAGVTGLTSAVFLAEAGYEVTIIAAHVPGDTSIEYTSPWAGAHWRTHADPRDTRMQDWDVQTYIYWQQIIERERLDPKSPPAGLKLYDSHHYWIGPVREELWWAPYVEGFRELSTSQEPLLSINGQLPAEAKIQNAAANRSIAINVPQYLLYLQERAKSLGVKVIKARIGTDAGLTSVLKSAAGTMKEYLGHRKSPPDCFVNASGLGAKKLCGDQAMYPIRGQTVLVKGEAARIRTQLGGGYNAYCIPRPGSGTTILGGTKEANNWSEDVDPATTDKILKQCSFIVPELLTGKNGGFEVVSVQCGLRPGRHGGARVEIEKVGDFNVVHAYGHAGGGYQNSVGSARLVVKLVDESMTARSPSARL